MPVFPGRGDGPRRLPERALHPRVPEVSDGSRKDENPPVRSEGPEQGRARDARTQTGNAPVWPLREEGYEPPAGDRDRSLRSAPGGSESSEEARRLLEVSRSDSRAGRESFARTLARFYSLAPSRTRR